MHITFSLGQLVGSSAVSHACFFFPTPLSFWERLLWNCWWAVIELLCEKGTNKKPRKAIVYHAFSDIKLLHWPSCKLMSTQLHLWMAGCWCLYDIFVYLIYTAMLLTHYLLCQVEVSEIECVKESLHGTYTRERGYLQLLAPTKALCCTCSG